MARHSELTGSELHASFPFVFDTELDRISLSTVTEKDLGKLAWQKDNNSFYSLVSVIPIKWEPIASQSLFQKLCTEQISNVTYNSNEQIDKISYTNDFSVGIVYDENFMATILNFFKGGELLERWNYSYDEFYRMVALNIETF